MDNCYHDHSHVQDWPKQFASSILGCQTTPMTYPARSQCQNECTNHWFDANFGHRKAGKAWHRLTEYRWLPMTVMCERSDYHICHRFHINCLNDWKKRKWINSNDSELTLKQVSESAIIWWIASASSQAIKSSIKRISNINIVRMNESYDFDSCLSGLGKAVGQTATGQTHPNRLNHITDIAG